MSRISVTHKGLSVILLLSGEVWEQILSYYELKTADEEAQTFTLPEEMPQALLKFKLITRSIILH